MRVSTFDGAGKNRRTPFRNRCIITTTPDRPRVKKNRNHHPALVQQQKRKNKESPSSTRTTTKKQEKRITIQHSSIKKERCCPTFKAHKMTTVTNALLSYIVLVPSDSCRSPSDWFFIASSVQILSKICLLGRSTRALALALGSRCMLQVYTIWVRLIFSEA